MSEAAASTDYHHHRSLTLAATLWNNGEHLNAFTLYFKVTDAAGASPERQVALLLTIRRPILPDVYNTLSLRESTPTQPHPEFDLNHMVEPLDLHFSPKQKEVYSRYIFQTQVQAPNENFRQFPYQSQIEDQRLHFWLRKGQDDSWPDMWNKQRESSSVHCEARRPLA